MRTDHGAGTLADRLRSGPLRRAELEQLAQDLLEMLSSLHAEGTLHRDLNAATVRLDSVGRLHSSRIGHQRSGAGAGESGVSADLFACGALLAEAAGPDAPAPVLVLIGMLTAAQPDLRPASAAEALALLGASPAPPAPRAPATGYRQTFEKPSAASAAAVPPLPVPGPPPVPAPAPAEVPTQAFHFPPLTTHAAVVDTPPLAPAVSAPAYPPIGQPVVSPLPYRRRRFGRRAAFGTAGAVLGLAVLLGGAVAFTGADDSAGTQIPPPAAASLPQRLDDLDRVIDTLGG